MRASKADQGQRREQRLEGGASRGWRRGLALAPVVLWAGLIGVTGCSGGSNSSNLGPMNELGAQPTPAGTITPTGTVKPTGTVRPSTTPASPTPVSPTPVPGGGDIVFSSTRGGDAQLYILYGNGRNLHRLTPEYANDRRSDTLPVLNASRTKIAYVSQPVGAQGIPGTPNIWIMDANGANRHQLTTTGGYAPAFSPDGSKLVFVQNGNIGEIDVSGRNFKLLAAHRPNTAGNSFYNTTPSFSPDGKTIVYAVGGGNQFFTSQTLYLMNADGSQQRVLTSKTDGPVATAPRFSPDGRTIFFETDLGRNPFNEISIINADGSGNHALIIDTKNIYQHPAWSPDGHKIVFASNRTGRYQLYTANADGTGITALTTSAGQDTDPDWR